MSEPSVCFLTLATPGHFAHYLPLYTYVLKKFHPDVEIDTVTTGELDRMTLEAFSAFGSKEVLPRIIPREMRLEGEANLWRFLISPKLPTCAYTLITDVDLLLFNNPVPWHLLRMGDGCFAGHRGPKHKPARPEIHGAGGWTGEFERTAGGFFLVKQEWYPKTVDARFGVRVELNTDVLHPTGWREMDEVMLSRIIKSSGMPMPTEKAFPPELRGIHLGDFKESMRHRWTSLNKMAKLLTNENCFAFRQLEADVVWQRMLSALRGDTELMQELQNVRTHCSARGM